MAHHRKFGWKPDLPDQRDKNYSAHHEMEVGVALPPLVDLRSSMSPIEDQGQLGSCVAHATVGTLEYLELLELKASSPGKEVFVNHQFSDISRLFVYYNARVLDGDPTQDNGTQLRSAIMAIKKWGICREIVWPYNQSMVNHAPPSETYKEGTSHIIVNHYRLDNSKIAQLKQCLAQGYPFILGISVYDSFMSAEVANTGMVPMPSYQENVEGGHALCCVGYDDSKHCFIIRNSWGTGWGQKGYCYIPYSYLTDQNLASDFWTLRKE